MWALFCHTWLAKLTVVVVFVVTVAVVVIGAAVIIVVIDSTGVTVLKGKVS
jgi:hypothetical protein